MASSTTGITIRLTGEEIEALDRIRESWSTSTPFGIERPSRNRLLTQSARKFIADYDPDNQPPADEGDREERETGNGAGDAQEASAVETRDGQEERKTLLLC